MRDRASIAVTDPRHDWNGALADVKAKLAQPTCDWCPVPGVWTPQRGRYTLAQLHVAASRTAEERHLLEVGKGVELWEIRAGVQPNVKANAGQKGGKAPRRQSTARQQADAVMAELRAQSVPETRLVSKAAKSVPLSKSQLRRIARLTDPALRRV
jgi:hypothetical protein